jgi:hypothetical protein
MNRARYRWTEFAAAGDPAAALARAYESPRTDCPRAHEISRRCAARDRKTPIAPCFSGIVPADFAAACCTSSAAPVNNMRMVRDVQVVPQKTFNGREA